VGPGGRARSLSSLPLPLASPPYACWHSLPAPGLGQDLVRPEPAGRGRGWGRARGRRRRKRGERGAASIGQRGKKGGRAGRASLAPTDRPTPPRSRALPATPAEGWAYVGGRRDSRRVSRPLPPPSLPPPNKTTKRTRSMGGCHGVLSPRVCVRRREPAAPALSGQSVSVRRTGGRARVGLVWACVCGKVAGHRRALTSGGHTFSRVVFLFFLSFLALKTERERARSAPTVPSFHAPGRRPGGPGQITKHAQACSPSLSHPLLSLRARAGIRQHKKERARARARSTRHSAQKRKKMTAAPPPPSAAAPPGPTVVDDDSDDSLSDAPSSSSRSRVSR